MPERERQGKQSAETPVNSEQEPQSSSQQKLHELAEERARSYEATIKDTRMPDAVRQVLHEMRVHQFELALLNEDLRWAQEQLERGRARYYELYNQAPVGYLTLGDYELILESNLAAASLMGVALGGMINKPLNEFIFAEDKDIYRFYLNQLSKTGELQSWELRVVRDDGTVCWVHLRATIGQGADGNRVCYVIMSDITQRRLAEEALRLQGQIMANLFDGIALVRSSDGIIVHTSTQFEKMFGYDHGELIGKHVSAVNANSDRTPEELAEEIMGKLKRDGVWDGEILNVRKNGTTFWCRASVTTFQHDAYGAVWVSVHTDITQRKLAENAGKEAVEGQRRSEERYRNLSNQFGAILDHLPALIFYKDENNNFVRINRYLAESQGKPKGELEGRNLAEIYPKADADKYYEDDLLVMNSGVARLHVEERWETAGGVRWVSTSKIPFLDNSGKTIGVIGMSIDITDRKRAETERELLIGELKTALEQVKTLSGLIPICSYCRKIRDDKGYWSQLEKYLIEHTDAMLTHGICPDCAEVHFPGSTRRAQ